MRFFLLFAMLSILYSQSTRAASIEQQALDFGTLVILKSDQIGSVIIKDDGSISTSGEIYILKEGRPAELILTDIPPGTRVSMNLVAPATMQHNTKGSSSADFRVTLNGFPKDAKSDEFSEVHVFIGGKLEINTSGKQYVDGDYSTTTNLEISVDY